MTLQETIDRLDSELRTKSDAGEFLGEYDAKNMLMKELGELADFSSQIFDRGINISFSLTPLVIRAKRKKMMHGRRSTLSYCGFSVRDNGSNIADKEIDEIVAILTDMRLARKTEVAEKMEVEKEAFLSKLENHGIDFGTFDALRRSYNELPHSVVNELNTTLAIINKQLKEKNETN